MNARLYDEAIALAGRTRWHPRNLARAAHDFAASNPQFAVEALLVALRWIAAAMTMTSRVSTCLLLSRTPETQPETPGSSMKRKDQSMRGSPVPRATAGDLIAPALRTRRDS